MFVECQHALTLSGQQQKQITLSEAFHWQLQGTRSHSLNLETLNANVAVDSNGYSGTSLKTGTLEFDFAALGSHCELKQHSCFWKGCFQTCMSTGDSGYV